jgi:hypothetical protein
MVSTKTKRIRVSPAWESIFAPKFELISEENWVYADHIVNRERKRIGVIDYVARRGSRIFVIEEDLSDGDKWHWCKILAYRAAFLLDNPALKISDLVPCVFLQDGFYSDTLRNILSMLKIEYIFFKCDEDEFTVTKTSIPNLLRVANRP